MTVYEKDKYQQASELAAKLHDIITRATADRDVIAEFDITVVLYGMARYQQGKESVPEVDSHDCWTPRYQEPEIR